MEIIVLLNDAAICTIPFGTFFFSFFLKTFFFPPAFAMSLFFEFCALYFVLCASLRVRFNYKVLSTKLQVLLLARRLFLRDRRSSWAFTGTRVCMSALTSDR